MSLVPNAPGPVRRRLPHVVDDISFGRHVVACRCGDVIRVRPDRDEPRSSVDERLATKYRLHRTGDDDGAPRSHH